MSSVFLPHWRVLITLKTSHEAAEITLLSLHSCNASRTDTKLRQILLSGLALKKRGIVDVASSGSASRNFELIFPETRRGVAISRKLAEVDVRPSPVETVGLQINCSGLGSCPQRNYRITNERGKPMRQLSSRSCHDTCVWYDRKAPA